MHLRFVSRIGLFALLGLLAPGALAQSSLPSPQTVEYRIHDDPDDPASPIVMRILMTLVPESASGNSVTWWVASIQFRHPVGGSEPDAVWTAHSPVLQTSDGYWTVAHSDPLKPERTEFAVPPQIVGYAESAAQMGPQLHFDFQGHAYTPPASGAPYGSTTAMDCEFILPNNQVMIPRRWSRPVDLPPGGAPPNPA